MDELKIHFSQFDVVGVCETWFNDTHGDAEISWIEKMLYRNDRVGRSGGVAFYVKKNWQVLLRL